jgi:hypothetical protein
VTIREKRKNQTELKKYGAGDWSVRTVKLPPSTDLSRCQLSDLIGPSSIAALQLLGVNSNFILNEDPTVWEEALWYNNAEKLVKSLKVVNDMAERAIKLITDCNSHKRTKNEDELQKIIQTIEDNRKRLPNASKRTFSEYLTR